jgi:hypothetical protein
LGGEIIKNPLKHARKIMPNSGALKARCSKAQGEGCEAAETLGDERVFN